MDMRIAAMIVGAWFVATAQAAEWPFWGGDLHNTHHAMDTTISADNVANLEIEWIYDAGGSVSSIPTVADDVLYFTDWGRPSAGFSRNPHCLADAFILWIVAPAPSNGSPIWCPTTVAPRINFPAVRYGVVRRSSTKFAIVSLSVPETTTWRRKRHAIALKRLESTKTVAVPASN